MLEGSSTTKSWAKYSGEERPELSAGGQFAPWKSSKIGYKLIKREKRGNFPVERGVPSIYRRFLPVAKQLWLEQGYKPFYRGGLTLAVRGFIVNAAVFLIYENVLKILNGWISDEF